MNRTLRALYKTPMRDLIRGRATGRLDRDAITEGLPEPVRAHIERVVKRTRLWRLEKADVTRELAAHFRDGLDAGRDADTLIRDFGRIKTTARLIRRARKRNRPAPWRAMIMLRNTIGILCVGLFTIYVFLFIRYNAGEPKITHNYAAELNAPIEAIPEQDRAWPVYLEALRAIPAPPKTLENKDLHCLEPGDELWDEALAYHAQIEDGLAILRRAAGMPALGYAATNRPDAELERIQAERSGREPRTFDPPSNNPLLIEILLPQLTETRSLARLLAFDMNVAQTNSNPDRWVADLDAILGIAGHAQEYPVIIGDLVSMAAFHLALDRLDHALADDPAFFSDAQLEHVAHSIAGFGGGHATLHLEAEHASFMDLVQRCFTDDGHGNGHFTNFKLLDSLSADGYGFFDTGPSSASMFVVPLVGPLIGDRKWTVETYDRWQINVQAQLAGKPWERETNPVWLEVTRATDTLRGRAKYALFEIMLPAIQSATSRVYESNQRRSATLTAIALELYRRKHGEYPATLDELVPALLPAVPLDLHTGDPMCYKLTPDGPVLYSRGGDRDDDGGRPPAKAEDPTHGEASRWHWPDEVEAMLADPRQRDTIDGDWILFPPYEGD